jgi:hypothetical protein
VDVETAAAELYFCRLALDCTYNSLTYCHASFGTDDDDDDKREKKMSGKIL